MQHLLTVLVVVEKGSILFAAKDLNRLYLIFSRSNVTSVGFLFSFRTQFVKAMAYPSQPTPLIAVELGQHVFLKLALKNA